MSRRKTPSKQGQRALSKNAVRRTAVAVKNASARAELYRAEQPQRRPASRRKVTGDLGGGLHRYQCTGARGRGRAHHEGAGVIRVHRSTYTQPAVCRAGRAETSQRKTPSMRKEKGKRQGKRQRVGERGGTPNYQEGATPTNNRRGRRASEASRPGRSSRVEEAKMAGSRRTWA